MKIIFKLYLPIFVLGFTLASCKPQVNLKGMLTIDDCEPPCWLSMTPGTTTIEMAYDHLSRSENVIDQKSIFEYSPTEAFPRVIGWHTVDSDIEGTLFFRDGLLYAIDINSQNEQMNLEDGIQLYGNPEKVAYQWQGGDAIVLRTYLLYFEKGLVLSYPQKKINQLVIDGNQKIDNVVFYASNIDQYPDMLFDLSEKFEINWPGFTKIEIQIPDK